MLTFITAAFFFLSFVCVCVCPCPKAVSAPTPRPSFQPMWLCLPYQTDLLPDPTVQLWSPRAGHLPLPVFPVRLGPITCAKTQGSVSFPGAIIARYKQPLACSICLPPGADQSLPLPVRPCSCSCEEQVPDDTAPGHLSKCM